MKKNTFILCMIFTFSLLTNAQDNYTNLWEKVEKFEVDNLPKSALTVVDEIYTQAAKEKNSPQVVKTLFYKSKFSLILEEDAQLKVVNQFKEHIAKSTFPTKNVLENVLANLYWQYFNQNRYKFYNRTQTENKIDSSDFRTWDLQTLFKEIHIHYKNSLKDKLLLQQIPIHKFGAILEIEKNSKIYRPTLFDFLSHNALTFYKTSETSITKPKYQFKIDNVNLLEDARTFSTLTLETKDSLSLQLNAVKIYQDLVAAHVNDKTKKALVTIDLERLQFVKQHAVFKNKDSLYLQRLKDTQMQYKGKEESGLYAFEIAKIYQQQANTYGNTKDETIRFKNKEAMAICNSVIKEFPNSLGAKKCRVLTSQIKQQTLTIKAEKHIPLNTHSRVLINYKNIDTLYFSAYKISREQEEKLNRIYDDVKKTAFIEKLKKVTTWSATLRNERDYLQHTTEVVVPKFNNGNYLLVASENKEALTKSIYGTTTIQVTNITLVENNFDGKYTYQVVNRNNGKPLQNAKIHIKNHSTNRYNKSINKHLITDKNGFASFRSKNRHSNVKISIQHKKDAAIFGNYYFYNQRRNSNTTDDDEIIIKPFIFTDRSIYRPGQTLYFKAIVIKKQGDKSDVFKNEFVEIILSDVNGQEVKTLDVKLNEFGSVAAEFIIPNNGLTGEYTIEVDESLEHDSKFYNHKDFDFDYNRKRISVEEYKRPKFETAFKPITKSYKLNDSITVNGFAKSFSGSNITEAKVVYRVHRKVQYPSWYYWRRPNFGSRSQEITHGETVTDSSGNFSIQFIAQPDESVSKENLPIFTYEVTADVTDINGETRSATSNVRVGYHSLLANLSMASEIDKKSKNEVVSIATQNLNGEFVPAKGSIAIYKLKAPKNPLRKRVWSAPDYQDISETEFRTLFPHEPYTDNESDEQHWKKGKKVFESNFDTSKEKEIKLKSIKKWVSGKYIAILNSEDTFGQKVKDEQRFTVFSDKENSVADNQLFSIKTDKSTYKPNENVVLQMGSASKDLTAVIQIEKEYKVIATHIVHLHNEIKTLTIPVNQSDIGGFAIKYHYVNYNAFNSGNMVVNVPQERKNIEIETTIFRDKLQPGQDETWSFTIKNDKKDKIAAEVLASMYDASLDEFKPHSWSFNPISYKSYYSYNRSTANHSFGTGNFRIRNNTSNYYNYPNQRFDSYNWFGFSFDKNSWKNRQYLWKIKFKIDNTRKDFDGIVSGIIEDENGDVLPGVSILIKGTTFGTETDFDGNYSLKVKKGDVLVFHYLGFKTLERTVDLSSKINVLLEQDTSALDEIVVVGYGTENKRHLTGAVGKVRAETVTNALTGRVAGVMADEIIESEAAEALDDGWASKNASPKWKDSDGDGVLDTDDKASKKISFDDVKIRKNLQETAFFFPQLKTDKNGQVSFEFTAPEALTRWKLQLLAHTTDLQSATKTLTTVTQKELMVVPNAPRFLREGDQITFSAKVSNLSNNSLNGFAQLQLTDAITGKDITKELLSKSGSLPSGEMSRSDRVGFSVNKKGNTNVSWNLTIPETVQAVQYKVVAKAGNFSDGEQNALPVLSNRMLVTETLPMWIRSNKTKTFTLDKLKNQTSTTLSNHKLTLEMTSNPAWYAVQALPYLMEYPYECAEQTFSRYYANTLASHIANSNPRIQEVFNAWKSSDALLSNLEKNQELKSLIIQETPWLRDAQSETEQKKRIALLFDLNKMKNEQEKSIKKLEDIQMNSGGFPWFKGGNYPNVFITQHIAAGFGHLKKLGVTNFDKSTNKMISKAVKFLDSEIVEQYKKLLKRADKIKKEDGNKAYEKFLERNHLGYFALQYLYMRSFYEDISMSAKTQKAIKYYRNQTAVYWNEYNLYAKGQIALIQHRDGNEKVATKILKSLKENSITSDELGMYWKENTAGYYYYQAPVETQALLIETFSEVGVISTEPESATRNLQDIDNLKIWLLKNKQTNRWKTTKATTEAVYALLLNGSDWISMTDMVAITVGNQKIDPSKLDNVKVEAGTGYFKTSWSGTEITPEMGEVTINKKGKGIAWGGLYWQYFEDLDKITSADLPAGRQEQPLKLKKKLFLKVNSDTGKELKEITKETPLKIGDLITVRIELRSDRNMEFIHMKDMRASGVEPINVISRYKWQDGLGYYESTSILIKSTKIVSFAVTAF